MRSCAARSPSRPRAVTVDLTGIGTQPATVLSAICAQLVWTLDQLSLHDVEVLVDGEPVDLDGVPTVQTTDDWESLDPDTVPASAAGHYLDAGALRTIDGKPVAGPGGHRDLRADRRGRPARPPHR